MKKRTITLQDGDAALIIDKNCESAALHEDKETGDVGSNTYLLMALFLATSNKKLMDKILNNAEKLLKNKNLKDLSGGKETKKGKK